MPPTGKKTLHAAHNLLPPALHNRSSAAPMAPPRRRRLSPCCSQRHQSQAAAQLSMRRGAVRSSAALLTGGSPGCQLRPRDALPAAVIGICAAASDSATMLLALDASRTSTAVYPTSVPRPNPVLPSPPMQPRAPCCHHDQRQQHKSRWSVKSAPWAPMAALRRLPSRYIVYAVVRDSPTPVPSRLYTGASSMPCHTHCCALHL